MDRTDLQLAQIPFVGRERELLELCNVLLNTRLISIVGVAGCGKTRLAAEIARTIAAEFQDGIAWIEFAPLSDPSLVVNVLGSSLDVRDEPDRPLLETTIAFLATKQILLVFDNCEHLLLACRALVEALLRACPEVQILSTGREALGVARERIYPIQPLTLPAAATPQAALASDAVRLFALCAAAVMRGFVLDESNLLAVVRICERLDGLPLAIELAAARLKILTVHEILERLDDRFQLLTRSPATSISRHQTLRAAIEWSYNLLSTTEQMLFRRLSIFAGGFALRAVESVCADDEPAPYRKDALVEETSFEQDTLQTLTDKQNESAIGKIDILDLVSALVEKSLVVVMERQETTLTHYRMLETVHEYANEKAEQAQETNLLHNRHLDWYVELAEQARPEVYGANSVRWFARLERERDNLRAALRWAIEGGRIKDGMRLATALWGAWEYGGNYSEGIRWLELLLADAPQKDAVAPVIRARALFCLGALLYRRGDVVRSERLAQESVALFEQTDDPAEISGWFLENRASAINLLAVMAADRGDFERAAQLYERALVFFRHHDFISGVSAVLHNLGELAHKQGNLITAVQYLEESALIKRQKGDRAGLALTLNTLGEVESDRAQYVRAEAYYRESLALSREIGGNFAISHSLNNLGALAYARGNYAEALTLLGESLGLANELGIKHNIALAEHNLGSVCHAQGEPEPALVHLEKGLALYRQVGETPGIAMACHHLAALRLELGDRESAAVLQYDALALFRQLGNRLNLARGLEGMANLAQAQGNAPQAAQFLGAAADLRMQMGTPLHVPERPRLEQTTELVQEALGERAFAAAFEGGRVAAPDRVLADALESSKVEAPSRSVAARPALEIHALGSSTVRRNGQALSSSDWTYVESKELFFYLLSHSGATKAQIGLDIWSDASPAQLRSAFHRAMHHVRKALDQPESIRFENDRYSLSESFHYFYDVNAFESALAHALPLARGNTSERGAAVQALEIALQLYQGDFLPDLEGGDWIVIRREALRGVFVEALLMLGALRFDAQEYERAEQAFRRVVATDEYLEIGHRELMRCLARQGEVSRALRHYREFADLLQSEIGALPSPLTRELYERLRRGEAV